MKNHNLFLIIFFILSFFLRFFKSENYLNLPSILLGSLLPILIYFLITQINQKAYKTAIIATIVATFNPYLIIFSRSSNAWPSNILTFSLVLISLLLFKYINSKSLKYLFTCILIFIIPIVYGLFFSNVGAATLFNYSRPAAETQTIINETSKNDYQIFHNQFVFFLRNFSSHYFNYFSPRFLIFEGDWQNTQYLPPYVGVILYPSLIFLILGIFFALTRKKLDKINLFFLFWLLIAPIPAALTQSSIQVAIAMPISIPLIYFISLGIYFVTSKYKNIILYLFIIGIYLASFFYYADLYLNHLIR